MQESDFYKKFEHFLFGSLLHKISVYFFKLRRWDKIEGVKLFTGGGGFFAARRCACFNPLCDGKISSSLTHTHIYKQIKEHLRISLKHIDYVL